MALEKDRYSLIINYINVLKKLFIILLISITMWNMGSVFASHWSSYSSHNYWQRFSTLKQIYLDSQYVNKHPKGWIPDEEVNAYAGGAYMKGVLPQLIAPDTPPFGRYIAGVSALIFNNENILVGIIGLCSLLFLFLLGRQIYHSTILALLPVTLLTFEKIFLNQFIYVPLLDGMQLCFLLGSFYFFNIGFLTKKKILWYLVASVFLGFFIATKFFITGIVVIGAWYIVLLLHKKKKDISLLSTVVPLSILILLVTYVRSFWFGYSLKSFLGIQKYIFLYHKSQLILPFSIWPLLLLNKWYVWYGASPIISDSQWQFSWPIITIISCIVGILYIFRKIQQEVAVEVVMVWALLYILFFSFGQITSRYLVIYIPVLYIITIYGIQQCVQIYISHKKL